MGGALMEGLAYLVAILLMTVVLGGPVAIGLTKIRTTNMFLTFIRRMLHGLIVAASMWVGIMFLFAPGVPLIVHIIGLFGITMGYIASRREYFPEVRIITPLLSRLGIKGGSDTAEQHGPLLKWRRNGRPNGSDGNGPGGQD